jgi:hypothetical protein
VMRKFWLTLALVALLSLPVLAQFRFGGGFNVPLSGDMLLLNKSVQDQLKLTADQKKAVAEIGKQQADTRTKMFEAFKDMDKDKAMEIAKKGSEETAKSVKKLRESLSSEQAKRFAECEVQAAASQNDVNIFKIERIAKALKLSDDQQKTIKETLSDLAKDVKEVEDENKGDFKKAKATGEKVRSLRKDAYEKITKSFSESQKKALADLGGEKFEFKLDNPFGKGKFGKGKGKKKKEKDDF